MYLYFLFYTTMSECMIFYGPTVPEINYSILFYSILFYSIVFCPPLFLHKMYTLLLLYEMLMCAGNKLKLN